MTVHTLKSHRQAASYYKAEAGIAAYYSQDGNLGRGQWVGTGAAALGLAGAADPAEFEAALVGRLPGGIEIAPPPGGTHRPGVDLTFSAPKAVSLAALAVGGGDHRLIELHDQAVAAALQWVEREHLHARRGHGGVEKERTGNMAAVQFRHVTARPVDGITDPQLHTHNVVINSTMRPDGKWVSARLGLSNDWIKAGGAVYRAELAMRLREAGYEIRQTKDGFELAGITDEQIKGFSQRSTQVEVELARNGKSRDTATAAQKDAANLRTRQGKERGDANALRAEWVARTAAAGVTRESCAPGRPRKMDAAAEQAEAMAAVASAVRHLEERRSAFSRDAILGYAAQAAAGRATVGDVQRAIDGSPDLLRRDGMYTTREAVARESHIIGCIRDGQNGVTPISVGAELPESLKPAQHRAARHILDTADRYIAVQGVAGAGKTFTMLAVTDAAQAAGFSVIGLAPTHKAARELRDAGITDVKTVAHAAHARDAIPQGAIVVIDEAGMMSARDFDAVLRAVERADARAVFIGDTRQLLSVEAGSPFRQMQDTTYTAQMDQIVRQTNPHLRETVQAFAAGDAGRGAELARNYIHETEAPDRAAASAYLAVPAGQRGAVFVLTDTNASRREINQEIRAGLQAEGTVRGPAIEVRQLVGVDMTREEARQAHNYEPGQIVQFQRDYRTRGVSEAVERGAEYRVVEVHVDHVTLETRLCRPDQPEKVEWTPAHASKVMVAEEKVIPLAVGDQIVFRETDRESGICNGDKATVAEVDGERGQVRLALERGGSVDLDAAAGGRLDYSYCQTVHASQGQTCDRVIVAAHPDSPLADARQGYVSLSRAREDAQVYTSDSGCLVEKWAAQAERGTAREAAGLDPQAPAARADAGPALSR